jgi:hypothetical protein
MISKIVKGYFVEIKTISGLIKIRKMTNFASRGTTLALPEDEGHAVILKPIRMWKIFHVNLIAGKRRGV